MDIAQWWSSLHDLERQVVWINYRLEEGGHFSTKAYSDNQFQKTTLELHTLLLKGVALPLSQPPTLPQLWRMQEFHCVFSYDKRDEPAIETARMTLPMQEMRRIYWSDVQSTNVDFTHLSELRSLSCSGLYRLQTLRIERCRKLEFCSLTQCRLESFDSSPFPQLSSLTLRGNPLREWTYSEHYTGLYSLDLAATELQRLDLRLFRKLQYLEVSHMRCLMELQIDLEDMKALEGRAREQVRAVQEKIARYGQLQDWWRALLPAQRELLVLNARLSLGVHYLNTSNDTIQREFRERMKSDTADARGVLQQMGGFMPLLHCTHLNLHSEEQKHAPILSSLEFIRPLMPHLQTIDLSGCSLEEIDWENLPELRRVHAHNCQRLRSLSIRRCARLEWLRLDNRLPYPEQRVERLHLEHCPALTEVNASNQDLHTFSIVDCPKLEILKLSGNSFTDFAPEALPSAIKHLDIGFNKLQRIPPLACTGLEVLLCQHNLFKELSFSPNVCASLRELDCNSNVFLETLDLSGCAKLEKLHLSFMTRLHTLTLTGCRQLRELNLMTSLMLRQAIDLNETAVSPEKAIKIEQLVEKNRRNIEKDSEDTNHRNWFMPLGRGERYAVLYMLGVLRGILPTPISATQKLKATEKDLPEIAIKTTGIFATVALIDCEKAFFFAPLSPDLHLNSISRITPFFPRLTRLHISQQSQLKNLNGISACTHLEHLSVSLSAVEDISDVSNCPKLTRLTIDDCPLVDIQPLATLANLEYLDVSATRVRSLQPLHRLKNLRQLICADCDELSSEEIRRFKQAQPQCLVLNAL